VESWGFGVEGVKSLRSKVLEEQEGCGVLVLK